MRVKIYKELFCNLEPQDDKFVFKLQPVGDGATKISFEPFSEYYPVPNEQDTAILCTNKAIYEEAHDTLIKTNHFVHVTSDTGVPLQYLVNIKHVLVITGNNAAVDNFKGYVLELHLKDPMHAQSLGYIDSTFIPRSNLMILHRDLGLLCVALKS